MEQNNRPGRGQRVRVILMCVLAAVFVISVAGYFITQSRAKARHQYYLDMAQAYTAPAASSVQADSAGQAGPPISVDFDALHAVNEDIEGWIYCEGTEINYPIVHGATNDEYLRHDYEGNYSMAGSIFVEEANRPGFADSNTIIYGHHMGDGSMFAALESWQDQDFYEQHPTMWLLTPEHNYQIVIFSSYKTTADSGTYNVFTGPCDELTDYLIAAAQQSVIRAPASLGTDAHYVLLSTCASAYDSNLERCVLHGMLFQTS